ncbi:MAG: hypothetical protein ACP5LG_06385, partial [Conexivisphaera sp.]
MTSSAGTSPASADAEPAIDAPATGMSLALSPTAGPSPPIAISPTFPQPKSRSRAPTARSTAAR